MTYNKCLQHTILEEGEGAMIFATPKGLKKSILTWSESGDDWCNIQVLPKEKAYWNLPDTHEFHYNQAILRKVDKKVLKKTMPKNAEFKVRLWILKIYRTTG